MKNKHFYSHLIDESIVSAPLEKLELTLSEREEMIIIIHGNIHHLVLDLIMSELSKEDSERLLKHVVYEEHDSIWELLHQKIDSVEEKITKVIKDHLNEISQEAIKLINRK